MRKQAKACISGSRTVKGPGALGCVWGPDFANRPSDNAGLAPVHTPTLQLPAPPARPRAPLLTRPRMPAEVANAVAWNSSSSVPSMRSATPGASARHCCRSVQKVGYAAGQASTARDASAAASLDCKKCGAAPAPAPPPPPPPLLRSQAHRRCRRRAPSSDSARSRAAASTVSAASQSEGSSAGAASSVATAHCRPCWLALKAASCACAACWAAGSAVGEKAVARAALTSPTSMMGVQCWPIGCSRLNPCAELQTFCTGGQRQPVFSSRRAVCCASSWVWKDLATQLGTHNATRLQHDYFGHLQHGG